MVPELARDSRTWVTVASAVASAPLVVGGLVWIMSLPWLTRFGVGVILGVVMIATYYLIQLHRSQLRRGKALHIAQLCQLDAVSLTRLLSGKTCPSWIGEAPDFEKVTWLNKELEEIWPSLNEATSGFLKVILQSVLDPYKFSIIRKIVVKSVTLGTLSPLLGGIKFTGAGEDEAFLELELDWRHGQDAKIVIQLQTTGPLLTVQIKDFVVFGVLRLIFSPLRDQFPGFGAVTISLREPPTVDFQTKFLGGDILMIPGVDNAVDNIILTALTDILVWPNRLVIPILQGDYSYLQLKPVGQLEVELVEAQGLAKLDIWGESDPYAAIYIRRKQGCIMTSSTKTNTSSPIWNEKFTLDVEDPETQKLTIRVLDHDPLKPSDFIGAAELPLSRFEPRHQQDLWVDLVEDLKKPELKSKGKVHLRILFKLFIPGETTADRIDEQLEKEEILQRSVEANEDRAGAEMLSSQDLDISDKPFVPDEIIADQVEKEVVLHRSAESNEGRAGAEMLPSQESETDIRRSQ